MIKNILFVFLVLLFYSSINAQDANITLSGTVLTREGKPLEGAYVALNNGEKTEITDVKGHFSFKISRGSYLIICQHISMSPFKKEINIYKDQSISIVMDFNQVNLDQVVITAKPTLDVNSVNMGSTYMDITTLEKMPAFLGEVDVLKSITTLPGVVNAGEGSGGFYVRGGSADQNLILMDNAPIFNASHLFGFFSVYNPDALKSFSLQRSGISARYGGRISSILDVAIRDGNKEKLASTIGISPISAKVSIDGPIGQKTSFLLAGRGAYPSYILKMFRDEDVQNSKGYFYDANFKVSHQINENNVLRFSSYLSDDGFKFPSDTTYGWSNKVASLQWSHSFNENFTGNVTASKSVYNNNVKGGAPGKEFVLRSGIDYSQVKIDMTNSSIAQNTIDFGGDLGRYKINPGRLEVRENTGLNPVTLNNDYGWEYSTYLNDEIILNKTVSLAVGLRYSGFKKVGPSDVFLYENGLPRNEANIKDTISLARGDVEKSYGGLEPRASVKYSLNEESSLKLGYGRTRQYLQLISNTASITPVDVYKLSDNYLKPQIADQISFGYFLVTSDKHYEFSWEVYYKWLHNQIDYKDGAEIVLNPILDADIVSGNGEAYGSEWLIKKNKGLLTGWISLTYSRSFRTIDGLTEEETINNGLKYPSNYDKPISFNTFINYQIPSSHWSVSANVNYSTGRPITAADSWYNYYGELFANNKGRNQERMPDYHRLDISFNYESLPTKKVRTNWNITIYNVYGRKNPYSTFFKHYYGKPPGAYKLAVIGSPIPSLTCQIIF